MKGENDMKEKNYLEDYKKIVGFIPPIHYDSPEQQGNMLKKYSMFQDEDIQYWNDALVGESYTVMRAQ